jgi:hypothetical protein
MGLNCNRLWSIRGGSVDDGDCEPRALHHTSEVLSSLTSDLTATKFQTAVNCYVARLLRFIVCSCCSCRLGWDYVSELRPPTGLLFIPQIIYEYGEPWWNDIDSEKPKKKLGEKPVPVPLCPPQISHGLTREQTRASAVKGQRLTAWAMARFILQ